MLDFNDAPKQFEDVTKHQYSIEEIDAAIKGQLRNYVLHLFPNAQINRGQARIGSLLGEPGESLSVALDGADAGQWLDHNTNESGNAIQLWQQCDKLSFAEAVTEIKKWLGYDDAPLKKTKTAEIRQSQPKAEKVQLGQPDNTYDYKDIDGRILAQVKRYNLPDGKKTFRVWDAVASKAQQPNPKPLYNIPCISIAKNEIIFVEGEKAADALIKIGYPATSLMSGGNSRLDKTDFSPIAGKKCVLWRDNDATGLQWQAGLVSHLESLGCATRTLKIGPNIPDKGDAADMDADFIHSLINGPQEPLINWIPASKMEYILKGNWIVKQWIPGTGLGCLYGDPGSGKTFAAADLGLHIATEMNWQDNRTNSGKVAYLAMESGTRFQNRILAWCDYHGKKQPENFIYTPTTIDLRRSEAGAEQIIESLKDSGVKVVIIDTLSRALAGGNENSPEDMMAFVNSCDRIWKELNCFVLIIHHVGKDSAKGMRGHSSLLGAIDTELQLKDKTITLLKQRDGQDGLFKFFDLEVKEIGTDEDNEPITTCVAVQTAQNNSENFGPKLSGQQQEAFQILCNLMLESGIEIQSPVDKTKRLRAAHLERWKSEIRNHGVTDGKDDNSNRVLFNKLKQALKKKDKIMFYENDVWIINETA